MAVTIGTNGIKKISKFGGVSSGAGFFLREGVNKISYAYKQSTETSNHLYIRFYWQNDTATTSRMRVSYNTILQYGSPPTNRGNNSGSSSTGELCWLNYYTSDSASSAIEGCIDMTIIATSPSDKIQPCFYFESSYPSTTGADTFFLYGGGKILQRSSSSEMLSYAVIWSASGSTMTRYANFHYHGDVFTGT